MTKIKAILVDDEESARNVLSNLLMRFCPDVELLDKCANIPQAVASIHQHKPDLVFLDIQMPQYSGYEIVKFFEEIEFEIIFVTAFDNYAVRAFEMAAVDYLLKPVDIERLKLAVNRARTQVDLKMQAERLHFLSNALQTKEVKNIMVSEKGYQQIIPIETIIAIEAQESYCLIYTTDKKYTVSKNLKHYETMLEANPEFLRVHKSWMIHKAHIQNYSKSDLSINMAGGLVAKLSKYKKVEFEEAMLG
jgi:two-component system, LytTR family, response regulator